MSTKVAELAPGSAAQDQGRALTPRCSCASKGGSCGCPGKATAERVQALASSTGPSSAVSASPRDVRARLGTGQPLPSSVRSRMETALGHDFSRVRVHAGGEAERAAGDLRARAFTVGEDVAFGPGDWQPGTPAGDAVLAHELAHVVQQRQGAEEVQAQGSAEALERDADTAAAGAVGSLWGGGRGAGPRLRSGLSLQRCGKKEAPRQKPGAKGDLDKQGQALIDAAKAGPPKDVAVGVVRGIIDNYFEDRADLVKDVVYDPKLKKPTRLKVEYSGRGSSTVGTIHVGNFFVEEIKEGRLARMALSVDHELFHIQQMRGETPQKKLGGTDKETNLLREFLAYFRTATTEAPEGTGRYKSGQRLNAIRGAIGYYNCLNAANQEAHADKRRELQKWYDTFAAKFGKPAPVPTNCFEEAD